MNMKGVICLLVLYWRLNYANALNRTIRQTPCGDKYECSSGECIDILDVCNGLTQCSDGSDEFPLVCDCGETTIPGETENVTGVRNAQEGSHPWHVSIYKERYRHNFDLLCSGALIYSDIVLTAATCVIDPDTILAYISSVLSVSLGQMKKVYDVTEPHQQKFGVKDVVVSRRYESYYKGYQSNVAIIKLKTNVTRTHYVKPVCLWTEKSIPVDAVIDSIVGWGLMDSSFIFGVDQKEATFELLDIKACINKYLDPLYIKYLTSDKFCLIFDKGVVIGKENEGTPVTIYYEGRHYLFGILSKQFTTQYRLGTVITKQIKWIRNTTYRLKQADKCLYMNHFYCLKDTACISKINICDGKNDCSDGADEDSELCRSIFGKPCIIQEQVAKFNLRKCGDSSNCSDKYSAPSNSVYDVACNKGQGFADPDKKVIRVICTNGEWIPSINDSYCLQLCKLNAHKSLHVECKYRGKNISCDEMLRPETEIEVSCKAQYTKDILVNYISKTQCRIDGTIRNKLSHCVPVCGVLFDISKSQTLISKGEVLTYAKYPWHVALYWKKEENRKILHDYKCGGTLLDSNKVLTAAHCVWRVNVSSLAVICGKLSSSWDIIDDWEMRFEVREVIIGTEYDGFDTRYANDIAVLILNEDVKLSGNVMPACLDLESSAGGIPRDQPGHIVGWGDIGNEEGPSESLREAVMDYLDLENCKKVYRRSHLRSYMYGDKFCALYRNGSGVQKGDSGGGLTFVHDDLHYVYGVVSIKESKQNNFAILTNVLSHAAWLKKILEP